jgi:drug/metabolite transporter (DMT)-like permease
LGLLVGRSGIAVHAGLAARGHGIVTAMADASVLAGMVAAGAAAACFDGAVILQAYEARQVDQEHALRLSLLARLARRRRWLLGTAIAIAGWPLQLAAYALAPVTVVQPCLALGLLLLLAAGSRTLDEPVGPREWAGAGAVIAGVVALGLSGVGHTEQLPDPVAVGAACGVLALIAASPFALQRDRLAAWPLIGAAGAAFSLTALGGKLLTLELEHGRPLAALGWALLVGAAAGAGFLIDMTAMQRFEATRVAPPMFVLETAVPVALAPLLFGESWSDTTGGGAVVMLGLLLVLGGGAVLGASRSVAAVEH